jgi:cytochrome P450
VLFFSVGYETSSQVLMYTSYLLAEYPECQERLYQEIKGLVDRDGELNHDNLKHARYLRAVIEESMRLYNPVLRMERKANEDFPLGDTGIVVEKGTIVIIPVWAIHHDPEVYPDPETYDPERFMDEKHRAGIRANSMYLPFGQGKRDCIGKDFAIMEIRAALAEAVLRYQLLPSLHTPKPLKFVPNGRPLLGPQSMFSRVAKRSVPVQPA